MARNQQNIIEELATESQTRNNLMGTMSSINGMRRQFNMQGGYDQRSVRVGKHGLSVNDIITKANKKKTLKAINSEIPSEYFEPLVLKTNNSEIPKEYFENDIIRFKEYDEIPSEFLEVDKFKGGGTLEEESKELSPIEYATQRFPILSTLEPINLQYDQNFKPREIGNFGDIEYMSSQYDTLPYYNDYSKNEEFKGKSTIVYNDNVSNEDIALDWLSHGLREHDPKWNKFLEQFSKDSVWKERILDELFGDFLRVKGIFDKYAKMSRKQRELLNQEFDEQEIDQERYNSVLDGLIRGILVNDEYREKLRYDTKEGYQDLENTFIWQLANEYLNNSTVKFEKGGKFNVIPEGALHARLHNMENADNITKKGIPVVSEDENGELEQQAEIEREEIIFRLEVTKKLEELLSKYSKEETSQKEKDELAIEAGKLLTDEILNNTIDNTNNLL